MRLSFSILLSLVVGCSDAADQADSHESTAAQQTAGFTAAPVVDSAQGTETPEEQPPKAVAPTAAEPSFNGGFEARAKGTCIPPPPDKPHLGWACDWPVGMPNGWSIDAPFKLGDGIYVQYAAGREMTPPLPNRTVPDNSALMAAPCVPYNGLTRANDGCVGTYRLVTDVFPVTPGANYRLSAWLRSTQSWSMATGQKNGVSITVAWFDNSGEWIRSDGHRMRPDEVPVVTWSQDWVDLTAPENAVIARADVRINQLGDRFVYVDDLRLEPQ